MAQSTSNSKAFPVTKVNMFFWNLLVNYGCQIFQVLLIRLQASCAGLGRIQVPVVLPQARFWSIHINKGQVNQPGRHCSIFKNKNCWLSTFYKIIKLVPQSFRLSLCFIIWWNLSWSAHQALHSLQEVPESHLLQDLEQDIHRPSRCHPVRQWSCLSLISYSA